ncbi:hypothetical protein H3H37_22290 [Duganella sp. LX20W]|uniref:Uncharacterized protein n=1 Tax=Rugamonas brunnea TaxID=2758569 RepID=A0A7W2IDZ8_9BURK|nr:hypothetical protein [Rugamonas brunnea]MBA5639795.1 hypothetical protein [Rugamonas brunnea]
MATIAMRVATSAASALQADNLPFKIQNSQQFVVAALFGNSVVSFEEMLKLEVPIVIDEVEAKASNGTVRTWERLLRDDVVFERVDKALRRAYERLGEPLPDPITLRFMKLNATDIVTKHVRQHGLFVYTQKLLFSPAYKAVAIDMLKEMKLPELPPVSASTAIASGRLPALPSNNLKEHLLFLGGQRMQGFGFLGSSFARWVAEHEPTLVEFPAPNLEPGRMARADRFTEHPKFPVAELGLGFFLATAKGQLGENISIVTPWYSLRQPMNSPPKPWSANFLRESVNPRFQKPIERTRLDSAFADIGRQSVRLKVCPGCDEIYSNDRVDLKLSCTCAQRT